MNDSPQPQAAGRDAPSGGGEPEQSPPQQTSPTPRTSAISQTSPTSESSSASQSSSWVGRRPVSRTLIVLFGWLVGVALFFWFFSGIAHMLLLFLAAATIASTLRPLVTRLSSHRWLSGPVVALGFWVVIACVLALLAWLLREPITTQMHRWPKIEQNLNDALLKVANWLNLAQAPTVAQIGGQLREWVMGSGHAGSMLAQTVSGAVSAGVALLLIIFGSIFLLAEPEGDLLQPLFRRLPEHHALRLLHTLNDLQMKLRYWLGGTLVSMVVIGVLTWLGLMIGGFQFALPMAAITGAAQIIPTIGAISAAVLALLLALTQGTSQVITVLIVYVLLHIIESYVLIPFIMKEAVRVPPVASLFTIVLWAELLGPLGLLLALPLDLTIWCFFYHFFRERDTDRISRIEQ